MKDSGDQVNQGAESVAVSLARRCGELGLKLAAKASNDLDETFCNLDELKDMVELCKQRVKLVECFSVTQRLNSYVRGDNVGGDGEGQ